MKAALLLLLVVAAVSCRTAARSGAADLIVTNARVWTGSQAQPAAEAVAMVGDRVAAIGRASDVSAWRGPSTRVIDAGGARVLPGFNDSHVHFISGGLQLDNVDLRSAPSPQDFARLIGASGPTASRRHIRSGRFSTGE
jgi:hypothetical protein